MKARLASLILITILVGWATAASPVFANPPEVLAKGDRIQFKLWDKGGTPNKNSGGAGSSGPSIPTSGQTWNHGNTCTVKNWTVSGNNPSTNPSAITVGIDTPSASIVPAGRNPVSDANNAIGEWGPGSGSAITKFVSSSPYSTSSLVTTTIANLCFAIGSTNNAYSGPYGGGGYDIHIGWVTQFSGQPNVLGEAQTYYFTGTYVIAFVLITIALSPGCCGPMSDAAIITVLAHEFGHANALGHSSYAGDLSCTTCFELMYKYIYGGSTSINLSSTSLIVRPSNLDVYALSSVSNSNYNNGPGVYFWFSLTSSLAKPGNSQADPWTWAPL